jgi:hypothetical protein
MLVYFLSIYYRQACGAGNRLSVYTSTGNVTVVPIPTIQKTGLPGSWSYTGCVREAAANRVLPYMNEWVTNNTVTACLNQCVSDSLLPIYAC